MNDSRKRLDNIFSEFINLVDNSDSEDQVVYSPLLELLNDALNKDNLYLKKLAIVDYKRLRDLIVNLEDDLTVFVADNGYGKTTILDAIAISLSWL
uniref:AAA family ATPase n=3 Tax=Klebsiella/Raoultella group TaxID=2890311 RepID=UPI0039855C3D